MAKKIKFLKSLVRGEVKKDEKGVLQANIVGYLLEVDGSKLAFKKDDAARFVAEQGGGVIEGAIFAFSKRTMKDGTEKLNPYLRSMPGEPSLKENSARIDRQVVDEKGKPQFHPHLVDRVTGKPVPLTEVLPQFAAAFAPKKRAASKKVSEMTPAEKAAREQERIAKTQAQLLEWAEQQK